MIMAESVIKGNTLITERNNEITFDATSGNKEVCSITVPSNGRYLVIGNYYNDFNDSNVIVTWIDFRGITLTRARTTGVSGGGASMMWIVDANVNESLKLFVNAASSYSGKKGYGSLQIYKLQ